MTRYVTIKKGEWRNTVVEGRFPVVREWKDGANGGFVTVEFKDGTAARVKCKFKNCEFEGEAPQDETIAPPVDTSVEDMVRANETEEEAEARIRASFEIQNTVVKGSIAGSIRGLIISGPPGVGKSYGVMQEMSKASMPNRLVGDNDFYYVVKGMTTPIALYKILWNYRGKNNVVVFDDCDEIFYDDVSLNLLKAALDSSKRRRICWNAESRVLKEEDIPNDFDFEGSVVFLTNMNFDNIKAKRLEPHLRALKSRCHYLDLTISWQKDILRRIHQLAHDGLMESYFLGDIVEREVVRFVEKNVNDLHELSLRTVLKVADLAKSHPGNWRELALHTVMRPEAKWRHIAEQQKKAREEA